MTPLLETRSLSKHFGGLRAVDGVSLSVAPGQILAIIGPNGSGKTTLFNVISGVLPATHGSVFLEGRDITRLPAYRVTGLGIARTFQNIRLFRSLTVWENVLVGRHCRYASGLFGSLVKSPRYRAEGGENREKILGLLEFLGLADRRDVHARNLEYGSQRRLEMVRALASEPKLLLLDEPAAGMNPAEIEQLLQLILKIRDRGVTIILIEHQMRLVMNIAERVVVLDHGARIAEGTPAEVQRNPAVIEAYLGTEE